MTDHITTAGDDLIKVSTLGDSISVYLNQKSGAQALIYLTDREADQLARAIQLARGAGKAVQS